MTTSQHVVVGAGLAGAATALGLARRGLEVTVVERRAPAAPDGSSHGSARIFRYAYHDEFYVRLVVRARGAWDEVERACGRTLISPTGALDFGVGRRPRDLARVLLAAGVEHELVPAEAARERWPGTTTGSEVLWHPDAGVVDAESAVTSMLGLARAHGAVVHTDWELSSVERHGTGLRLTATTGAVLDAERVVVAAGGWLPALLPRLPLPTGFAASLPPLQVRQEQAFHFPYADPGTAADWPTTIHTAPDIEVYSLPGGRDAGFRGQKVAEFNGGRLLPSAARQDGRVDPANRRRVVDHVRRDLPGLVPEPYAETTCLFTSTPTEDFVLDEVDGITVLSPCSGHGAKFAPLIGEIAADVSTGSGPGEARFRVRGAAAAGA